MGFCNRPGSPVLKSVHNRLQEMYTENGKVSEHFDLSLVSSRGIGEVIPFALSPYLEFPVTPFHPSLRSLGLITHQAKEFHGERGGFSNVALVPVT